MDFTNNESIRNQARKDLDHLKPKIHIKGFSKTKEELDSLPSDYECEKHGRYQIRLTKMCSANKMLYNDQCPECIKEFNLLVDKREQEISQELEEKAKQKRLNDRIAKLKELGVGKRYIDNSFDNYLTDTPEKQNALTKCKELCDDIMNDDKPSNLIMVGGVGTGKTHLANSMVINLFDNKKYSERINMIDMIRSLKSTWSKESEQTEEDLLKYFTSIDLLIVDEVGVQFNSDTEKMFVFDIINGRYENCLPTVIISNLDINGVKEVIGDRCVDRLREDGGKVIAFNWNSHR